MDPKPQSFVPRPQNPRILVNPVTSAVTTMQENDLDGYMAEVKAGDNAARFGSIAGIVSGLSISGIAGGTFSRVCFTSSYANNNIERSSTITTSTYPSSGNLSEGGFKLYDKPDNLNQNSWGRPSKPAQKEKSTNAKGKAIQSTYSITSEQLN